MAQKSWWRQKTSSFKREKNYMLRNHNCSTYYLVCHLLVKIYLHRFSWINSTYRTLKLEVNLLAYFNKNTWNQQNNWLYYKWWWDINKEFSHLTIHRLWRPRASRILQRLYFYLKLIKQITILYEINKILKKYESNS